MSTNINTQQIQQNIESIAFQLGFDAIGFSDINLSDHETHLNNWLEQGFHGEMDYMYRHGTKRSRPAELIEGTCSVISVRMDYMPENQKDSEKVLDNNELAYISRYALGRDYHKLMRQRLQKLAINMQDLLWLDR